MLKGKIYEYMKKYLDAYLYDFDESKLNMSFLSGGIQLTDLHIKQDMANRLIDSFGIPISMKAGLIKDVKINFSILSFWTSPLELEISDIYLVMGPSTFFRSSHDSYIEESTDDLLNTSYDSTNAFNVFDHEMKIKQGNLEPRVSATDLKSIENLKYLSSSDFLKERLIEEEKQVQNVRLIFRNIKLLIKRLHIRYEDDYYQADLGKKFVFGLTLNTLRVASSGDDWNLDTIPFKRVPVDTNNKFRNVSNDSANLLIKEIEAEGVEIYFESDPEIIIPNSVVEMAANLGDPRQVFNQVPVQEIFGKMSSVFNQDHYSSRGSNIAVEKFDC